MRAFAGLSTVTVEDGAVAARALDLAERGMDFADALHIGKMSHCEGMASFDLKFVHAAKADSYDTVQEQAPPASIRAVAAGARSLRDRHSLQVAI